MGKIEIHGLIETPLVRVLIILCKAIGAPYEFKELNPMNKSPEFKKLNPAQTVPVMVDDGFTLTESRTILSYLVDKYAKDDTLYPKEPKARAVVDARLFFDCGSIWPKSVKVVRPAFVGAKPAEEDVKELCNVLDALEEYLKIDKWVAGPNLTIADISISGCIHTLPIWGFNLSPYPKIVKWMEECKKNIPNFHLHDEGVASMKNKMQQAKKA